MVQSIVFAGMSGSAIADAAFGRMMQSMMTRGGKYTPSFAAALTAVSSVIAPIIPPRSRSSSMRSSRMLRSATSSSRRSPGLLLGLSQMTVVAILARRRHFPVEPPVSPREMPASR